MAHKTRESISTVILPNPGGEGIFLTPTTGELGYSLVVRRSYVTVAASTAQDAYSLRIASEPSLEEELAAWDRASEDDLAAFEELLGEE